MRSLPQLGCLYNFAISLDVDFNSANLLQNSGVMVRLRKKHSLLDAVHRFHNGVDA